MEKHEKPQLREQKELTGPLATPEKKADAIDSGTFGEESTRQLTTLNDKTKNTFQQTKRFDSKLNAPETNEFRNSVLHKRFQAAISTSVNYYQIKQAGGVIKAKLKLNLKVAKLTVGGEEGLKMEPEEMGAEYNKTVVGVSVPAGANAALLGYRELYSKGEKEKDYFGVGFKEVGKGLNLKFLGMVERKEGSPDKSAFRLQANQKLDEELGLYFDVTVPLDDLAGPGESTLDVLEKSKLFAAANIKDLESGTMNWVAVKVNAKKRLDFTVGGTF